LKGEEYSFFTEKILKKLEKSHIIIEIHRTQNKNDEMNFMKRVKKSFNVTVIIGSNNDF
jgi:histidinol phosphatase-like PHP family hydrolase